MSIKKVLYHIITICFCSLFVFLLPAFAWQGTVISVHDGDSMRIQRADGAVVTIRVYGIDCPGIGQPYGKEARDLTATLLMGKMVEVSPAQKSKSYGREVASIMQPDGTRLLQEALTASGLAWVDGRYCKQEACNEWRKMQQEAKEANPPRGLWADPSPVPPWQWRRMHRR